MPDYNAPAPPNYDAPAPCSLQGVAPSFRVAVPDGLLFACPHQGGPDGIDVFFDRPDGSAVILASVLCTAECVPACDATGNEDEIDMEELSRQDAEVPAPRRVENTDEKDCPWYRQHLVTPGLVTTVWPDGVFAGRDDAARRVFHYNYNRTYGPDGLAFFYLLRLLRRSGGDLQARIRRTGDDYRAVIESPHLQGTVVLTTRRDEGGNIPVADKALMAAYVNETVDVIPHCIDAPGDAFGPPDKRRPEGDGRLVNITVQTTRKLERDYHGVVYMVDTPPGVSVTPDFVQTTEV